MMAFGTSWHTCGADTNNNCRLSRRGTVCLSQWNCDKILFSWPTGLHYLPLQRSDPYRSWTFFTKSWPNNPNRVSFLGGNDLFLTIETCHISVISRELSRSSMRKVVSFSCHYGFDKTIIMYIFTIFKLWSLNQFVKRFLASVRIGKIIWRYVTLD